MFLAGGNLTGPWVREPSGSQGGMISLAEMVLALEDRLDARAPVGLREDPPGGFEKLHLVWFHRLASWACCRRRG